MMDVEEQRVNTLFQAFNWKHVEKRLKEERTGCANMLTDVLV